jgi:PIN domain nuclease of toxin-antitoxin system
MSEYVTDTHALYWHLTESPRLSPSALTIFQQADAGGHRIFVPGIILVEIVYLVEKGRITESSFASILKLLNTPNGSYRIAPLDENTAQALFLIPRESVPDMPDRIIAATAKSLKLPLLTCDGKITGAKVVSTIW